MRAEVNICEALRFFKRRIHLSKRKTGALRKKDPRFNPSPINYYEDDHHKTYYTKESKTVIDFSLAQQKQKSKKKVELIPKSVNQEKYILALTDPEQDVVVVTGPAGTGKTYLSTLAAIQALRDKAIDRLVLCRPAVSIEGENHGFLPGDLTSKLAPWVRPITDILKEFYSTKEIEYMISEEVIEFAPLGFLRGRTFKNTFLILDEAQNASPLQLKSLLTRIGEGSKFVIDGDTDQADRKSADNGLLDLVSRLKGNTVPGMIACEFDNRDIRRHRIIEHVLKMYS
jgi:phosphate starvation-inducible protein PhoH and related proteins